LPTADSGCDSLRGSRWNRVAAAAGGVPARIDGVWDVCPLGPRRRGIHDALRDRLRVRSGRDRCPTAPLDSRPGSCPAWVVATAASYKGFRYPSEIIAHCVWLYHLRVEPA
jgi:hypothetical protein